MGRKKSKIFLECIRESNMLRNGLVMLKNENKLSLGNRPYLQTK